VRLIITNRKMGTASNQCKNNHASWEDQLSNTIH
jgi:hypothetical protein